VKLALVVQRYAEDIGGGSELHARYIAEHLASQADVRVLTTCARDYVSWKNEYPAGATRVNGIAVERFPVARERDQRDFARRSSLVFEERHSIDDELEWLDSQGPVSPGLIARIGQTAPDVDFVLLFSLRYHTALHGARVAAGNAVVVPTTERDPAVGLEILGPVLRGARGIMYNTPEERVLIETLHHNAHVPGLTVGVGSQIPDDADPAAAAVTFGLDAPYVLYVGRIDVNKGCAELFDYFLQYVGRTERPLDLVLIGTPVLPIPAHPRIRHLGYVSDRDKYNVLAGAEALVMPSYFESLSMVMIEAWALEVPVLANGRCDVLAGQCLRSNGGLFYASGREFEAMLDRLLDDPALAAELGENGRAFYEAHYEWPVIERAYREMFDRLSAAPPAPMEPLPGWFARRRRSIPPAAATVDAAPRGPVRT
jgi:glycosyltransferase involved in cell wall biosynthesis